VGSKVRRAVCRAFVVVLGLGTAGSGIARDHAERFGTGHWQVRLQRDAFTGALSCELRSTDHRMIYQPGALGFRQGHRDTLHAWYRFDGGPALRWQDRYAAVIAAGVSVEGTGLDNPTAGIVWLPAGDLTGISSVAIRSSVARRVRTFDVRGYPEMVDAARRRGCWQH